MGLSPEALYHSVFSDLAEYLPFGPVGLGDIPPDASYKQFAASYLLSSIVKKFTPVDTTLADAAAKEKFFASNKKCKDWKLPLMDDRTNTLYGTFLKELDDFFHPEGLPLISCYSQLVDNGRVGPGSSIGANGLSLYAKLFSSQLTTTSLKLDSVFSGYFSRFPRFHEALAMCRETFGEPKVVDRSRCSFAPKTTDCSRMICVEPSLNMFFQLGLGAVLEDRLRTYFKVDLRNQPFKNRRLAQLGSKTGNFSTIDLSSASDSISIELCRQILPGWFFDTLMELRSSQTEIDGRPVTLEMISTMGNGFTFPLQTIIFAVLLELSTSLTTCGLMTFSRTGLVSVTI